MRRIGNGILALTVACFVLGLTACGGSGPRFSERLEDNPAAQAYLDRVARSCGKLRIGPQSIDSHFEQTSNDTFFVDATVRLYFGKIDRTTFAGDINAFYPSARNGPALACIFAQLNK